MFLKKERLRSWGQTVFPADKRSGLIASFSKLNVWYGKGIQVLAFIRNVEITDIGILMAIGKYFFGDSISNTTIIMIGAGYWVLNTIVNLSVGWFWEHHEGWQIEAQVRGKRVDATRAILVDPDSGKAYGIEELREAINGKK
jgi:hypothetical protein